MRRLKTCCPRLARSRDGWRGASERAWRSSSGRSRTLRIFDKAQNDYADELPDFSRAGSQEIAESCVIVLRARVVCGSGAEMITLLEMLEAGDVRVAASELADGEQLLEGASEARLKLLRCKSSFSSLDPTHFRFVICNCYLSIAAGEEDGTLEPARGMAARAWHVCGVPGAPQGDPALQRRLACARPL